MRSAWAARRHKSEGKSRRIPRRRGTPRSDSRMRASTKSPINQLALRQTFGAQLTGHDIIPGFDLGQEIAEPQCCGTFLEDGAVQLLGTLQHHLQVVPGFVAPQLNPKEL